MLQTQTRAYDALVESRLHMLRLRPFVRIHWVGLAVAYYLVGNLEEANHILERYQNFLRVTIMKNGMPLLSSICQEAPPYDPEYSELLLFHVRVLEDLGELQSAVAFLDTKAKDRYIVDRTTIHTCRGGFHHRLNSRLIFFC